MARQVSRRQFILTAAAGGIGLATGKINHLSGVAAIPFSAGQGFNASFSDGWQGAGNDLYSLSYSLTAQLL